MLQVPTVIRVYLVPKIGPLSATVYAVDHRVIMLSQLVNEPSLPVAVTAAQVVVSQQVAPKCDIKLISIAKFICPQAVNLIESAQTNINQQ